MGRLETDGKKAARVHSLLDGLKADPHMQAPDVGVDVGIEPVLKRCEDLVLKGGGQRL